MSNNSIDTNKKQTIKRNTKKKKFEYFEKNSDLYKKEANESIFAFNNSTVIATYEDNTHIGVHIRSNTKSVICKCCNKEIKRFKAYVITVTILASYNEKVVLVKAENKKFHCADCKATTQEILIQRKPKSQITVAVSQSIIKSLKSDDTYKKVSQKYGISPNSVIRIFDKYCKDNIDNTKSSKTVNAIGVDEVSMIKTGDNKYQFVVIDHSNVNIVSIDLWKTYRDAFNKMFKDVQIVADRFHVVRLFTWAFSKARINILKENNTGTTKYWRLLTCRNDKLRDKGRDKLNEIFNKIPELEVIYMAKEFAYDIFKHQSLEDFKDKYNLLKEFVLDNELTSFYSALNTVEYWYEEICNMFIHPSISNGRVERINVSLNKMKRLAFGFRNKERTFKLAKHKINKVA